MWRSVAGDSARREHAEVRVRQDRLRAVRNEEGARLEKQDAEMTSEGALSRFSGSEQVAVLDGGREGAVLPVESLTESHATSRVEGARQHHRNAPCQQN